MKHRFFNSALTVPSVLASAAVLITAGFLIFSASDNTPLSLYSRSDRSSASAPDDTAAQRHESSPWVYILVAGVGGYVILRHFFRPWRKSFNGIPVDPRRVQAADQLRDALAVFNRPAFYGSDAAADLAPLYKEMVATRVELQNRNSRFMYDTIGAAHIQAVQQMLMDVDEDLGREWPDVHDALQRFPERPSDDEVARFRAQMAGKGEYDAVMEYLQVLRAEARKELVHAELRYRRLLS